MIFLHQSQVMEREQLRLKFSTPPLSLNPMWVADPTLETRDQAPSSCQVRVGPYPPIRLCSGLREAVPLPQTNSQCPKATFLDLSSHPHPFWEWSLLCFLKDPSGSFEEMMVRENIVNGDCGFLGLCVPKERKRTSRSHFLACFPDCLHTLMLTLCLIGVSHLDVTNSAPVALQGISLLSKSPWHNDGPLPGDRLSPVGSPASPPAIMESWEDPAQGGRQLAQGAQPRSGSLGWTWEMRCTGPVGVLRCL